MLNNIAEILGSIMLIVLTVCGIILVFGLCVLSIYSFVQLAKLIKE